jgi:hypothetical protein
MLLLVLENRFPLRRRLPCQQHFFPFWCVGCYIISWIPTVILLAVSVFACIQMHLYVNILCI